MLYIEDIQKSPDTFNLTPAFVKVLPRTCPECGSPMTIDEGLHTVQCTATDCPTYIKERFSVFFSLIGLGVSFKEIRQMIARYHYTTPLELFYHPIKAYLYEGIDKDRQNLIIERIQQFDGCELWKLIALAGRVSQGYAYSLFRDCRTVSDMESRIAERFMNPQSMEEARQLYYAKQTVKDLESYFEGTRYEETT